jgi:hypothetical protein
MDKQLSRNIRISTEVAKATEEARAIAGNDEPVHMHVERAFDRYRVLSYFGLLGTADYVTQAGEPILPVFDIEQPENKTDPKPDTITFYSQQIPEIEQYAKQRKLGLSFVVRDALKAHNEALLHGVGENEYRIRSHDGQTICLPTLYDILQLPKLNHPEYMTARVPYTLAKKSELYAKERDMTLGGYAQAAITYMGKLAANHIGPTAYLLDKEQEAIHMPQSIDQQLNEEPNRSVEKALWLGKRKDTFVERAERRGVPPLSVAFSALRLYNHFSEASGPTIPSEAIFLDAGRVIKIEL